MSHFLQKGRVFLEHIFEECHTSYKKSVCFMDFPYNRISITTEFPLQLDFHYNCISVQDFTLQMDFPCS